MAGMVSGGAVGRVVGAAALVLVVVGCNRGAAPDEATRTRCRSACRETYTACVQKCQHEAPLACEAQCDQKNRRCYEKCD